MSAVETTRYVFVYHPPYGWDLSQEQRDHIMATGNVVRIVRSSLYSLQWTELGLDYFTGRPLTCVLFGMSDRYGYADGRPRGEGNGPTVEPFEVIVAEKMEDVARICSHLRYSEWPGQDTYPADPDSPFEDMRVEQVKPVTKFEWRNIYTGEVKVHGSRPRDADEQ